jgi:CheY-like chemotaxis protein
MTSDSATIAMSGARSPRILIIDDNPSIHRDFDLVLAEEARNAELDADEQRIYGASDRPGLALPKFTLDHALSGLEGVEKVQVSLQDGRPYQLAFVDVRMPGIDGVATVERIWQMDPRVQIVICTAYADYSQTDLGRRLGFTDKLLVLRKPFDSIEVTQLAITLSEKWYLAIQAELKLEQMELLVAQRTRQLLQIQAAGPPPTTPSGEAAAAGLEPELPLVLLAEADPDLRLQLQRGLGSEFRVLEARDSRQGFELAREHVPDLVLANLGAGAGDGGELCRRLKQEEVTSHIPVILLSGPGAEPQPLQALEAGADDYFLLPLSPALVRARVGQLLQPRARAAQPSGPPFNLNPREIATNQVDLQFLRRTLATIEQHMSDFEFDVEALSRKMFMSRRQFFRKVRSVAGCAPNALIRHLRLKRAAQLLKESPMTVTEITYAVGFSDLKHFRSIFKEQFGVLPGDYAGLPAGLPGPSRG